MDSKTSQYDLNEMLGRAVEKKYPDHTEVYIMGVRRKIDENTEETIVGIGIDNETAILDLKNKFLEERDSCTLIVKSKPSSPGTSQLPGFNP